MKKLELSKKNVLISSAVLSIVSLLFYVNLNQKDKVAVKNYLEYTVDRESINVDSVSTGVVSPQNRLEVKSPTSGRIEKILVKEGDFVHKNQIIAWTSTDDRAALLDAASAKGPAERKKWEEIYPASPVMAPISGTIILKSFEEGQVFVWSDALFTISDRLTVKAQVDETDIAKIEKGQKAVITLDAYKDQPMNATVDKIAYDATTVNNVTSYIVDIVPQDVPKFLRSGMTATVKFHLVTKKDALIIPTFSVKLINGKNVVTLLRNGKRVEKEIKLGVTDGKKQEVINGLKEGDIVLVPDYQTADSEELNSKSLVNL